MALGFMHCWCIARDCKMQNSNKSVIAFFNMFSMCIFCHVHLHAYHFQNCKLKKKTLFTLYVITWLTVTEYLCHRLSRICSFCRSYNPRLFTGFLTRITRRVPLVKQELLNRLSPSLALVGFVVLKLQLSLQFLSTIVCFCSSLTIVFSVFRYTASDYSLIFSNFS